MRAAILISLFSEVPVRTPILPHPRIMRRPRWSGNPSWTLGLFGVLAAISLRVEPIRAEQPAVAAGGGILSVLATEAAPHEEGKAACTCFHENRHRMRYAQFEGQGLCTSTSVVEAGCKNAIGARLR